MLSAQKFEKGEGAARSIYKVIAGDT